METCSIFARCLNPQQVFIHRLWVEFFSFIKPCNDDSASKNLPSASMDTVVSRKWVNIFKQIFNELSHSWNLYKFRKHNLRLYVSHTICNAANQKQQSVDSALGVMTYEWSPN